ncbi:hypothetical protein [Paenibacillus sp. 1P03SA]|uniref:hypothetical protein n=1 Tax=Paenibacillus sp. 1P03SA TaxID=3132294 RepID=UPI0039A39F3B
MKHKKIKKRDKIEIWTYGTYDPDTGSDFGITFEVTKPWFRKLLTELGYRSIIEFFLEYDYTTSEWIYLRASEENAVLSKKCGRYGTLIK